jgi:hypothetical protein
MPTAVGDSQARMNVERSAFVALVMPGRVPVPEVVIRAPS